MLSIGHFVNRNTIILNFLSYIITYQINLSYFIQKMYYAINIISDRFEINEKKRFKIASLITYNYY